MKKGEKCGCGRTLVQLRKGERMRCWDCEQLPRRCDCPPISEGVTIHITGRAYVLGIYCAQVMHMDVEEWASKVMTDVGQNFSDSLADLDSDLKKGAPPAKGPVPITKMTKARLNRLDQE